MLCACYRYDAEPTSDAPPIIHMYRFNYVEQIGEDEPRLTHRKEFVLGNHEDGYLTGVDHLCDLWAELAGQGHRGDFEDDLMDA